MVDDIRAILSPLLFVCYVFGTRIIEYPANKPRTWCSYLYILLVWLTYSLLLVYTLMCYIYVNSIVYQFCFWLNVFTAILTIVLGMYHDKKFRSCLRKLAIVDGTLEELGTTTDYQKLYTRALLIVFVWCAFVLCITYIRALWLKGSSHDVKNLYVAFMLEYGTYTNLLDDLVITGTLGYIRLKFDQVNEYLRKMERGNEHELKPAWEHSASLPRRAGNANSTDSECATWIMIHLHLDLRKISRELNSIFGLQMSIKMGTYFAFMALGFRELFNVILISNYVEKTPLFVILIISFLLANTFRLFIINYMCEEVSVKANIMDIIRIPYTTYDVVVRENISQLILQINLIPIKFYGLGLFQFGLKFFQGFSSSVTTIIVILVQSHTEAKFTKKFQYNLRQFRTITSTAVKMNSTREILSPILFISYVLGTRIIEFPAGKPRLWSSFLYISLLWTIYHILVLYTIMHFMSNILTIFKFCFWLNSSIALLSVVVGMYYDKKYRTCLRQLDIVDDTLEKLGVVTDYQKLYTQMLLKIFGWFVYVTCTACATTLWYREHFNVSFAFYIAIVYDYSSYVNMLDDLLITSTLRYIGLKFEQLNECLRKLSGDNGHGLKQAWENSALLPRQIRYLKFMNSESATWIAIHLHLQLCKISRELNTIFGLQMTIKMGAYFTLMAIGFSELFNILLITNYNQKKTLFIILTVSYLAFNTFRLFIINYICEMICRKAHATGEIISKIPCANFDVAIRENISQFLLQGTLTPLKFYGLGLFKFGLRFFHGFSSSVSTVIVILVQSHTKR